MPWKGDTLGIYLFIYLGGLICDGFTYWIMLFPAWFWVELLLMGSCLWADVTKKSCFADSNGKTELMCHTIISESVFAGVVLKILSWPWTCSSHPQPLLESPAVQKGPPVHVARCSRTLVVSVQRWALWSGIHSFGRLVYGWFFPLL